MYGSRPLLNNKSTVVVTFVSVKHDEPELSVVKAQIIWMTLRLDALQNMEPLYFT